MGATWIEEEVARQYGWPLWMVRLQFDLAILEARAAKSLTELARVGRANPLRPYMTAIAGARVPAATWMVRKPGGVQ